MPMISVEILNRNTGKRSICSLRRVPCEGELLVVHKGGDLPLSDEESWHYYRVAQVCTLLSVHGDAYAIEVTCL